MNAKRRKETEKFYNRILDMKEQLEAIRDEEQEAFDNMPEPIQYSDRGQQMEWKIEQMNSTLDSMQEVIDYLENILND